MLQAIAKLCKIDVCTLEGKSLDDIIKQYILPLSLHEQGENFISSRFMQFLADYGQDCMNMDSYSSEVLLEIAMQRISKGAVSHSIYDLNMALSEKYRQYSSANDQSKVMDQACWNFLRNNLKACCKISFHQTWRRHAYQILFGLLRCFDYDGGTNGSVRDGYEFDSHAVDATPRDIYLFAESVAVDVFSKKDIAEKLAPMWPQKKYFFKKYEKDLRGSYKKIFNINLVGEGYFSLWQRIALRIFCCYSWAVVRKIRQEIALYQIQ